MLSTVLTTTALFSLTCLLHYEVLRVLWSRLPALRIPDRTKLLVAVAGVTLAHVAEAALYGLAMYLLVRFVPSSGTLVGEGSSTLSTCLYLAAESYTSLGFGDIRPVGSLRFLASASALNGLLLIGWSSGYLYLAMERFWDAGRGRAGAA